MFASQRVQWVKMTMHTRERDVIVEQKALIFQLDVGAWVGG